MLEAGVDYLSREGAVDLDAAGVTEEAWELVLGLAAKHNFSLQVDWFADEYLHQLPSYWTREACGGAEGTDALSAHSWRDCTCTACLNIFERASWLFPPTPLLGKSIAKAARDGAFGIAAIPYMPGAVWWPVLQNATLQSVSLTPQHLRLGPQTDRGVYSREGWRVVAFDFRAPRTKSFPEVQCACAHPTPQVCKEWSLGLHTHRELARTQALLAHEWAQGDTEDGERGETGGPGR